MTAKRPPAPRSLGPAGRDVWRRLCGRFDFAAHEIPALVNACAAFDDVARLEALLAEQGLMVEGSKGQAKLSPVVTQLRVARLAAARLHASLLLPVDDGAGGQLTPSQARAKKAATTRWGRVQSRRDAQVRRIEAL